MAWSTGALMPKGWKPPGQSFFSCCLLTYLPPLTGLLSPLTGHGGVVAVWGSVAAAIEAISRKV